MSVICATSGNARNFNLGLQRRPITAESSGVNLDRVTFSGGGDKISLLPRGIKAPWCSGSYVGGVSCIVKISRSPTWFTVPNFVALG